MLARFLICAQLNDLASGFISKKAVFVRNKVFQQKNMQGSFLFCAQLKDLASGFIS